MTRSTGRLEHLRFGGGASQTPEFARLLATVLDFPIEQISGSDLTCDGAAMLTAKQLGWPRRIDRPGETIEPDTTQTGSFDNLYRIYLDANAAVTPITHRLSALT